MNTDRDTARIIRSWLEEGVTELPDRVLDDVLDRIPTTRQRWSWWPARRIFDMNKLTKLAGVPALLALVAIVGYNLLPATGGIGGTEPTPSPSPTLEPTASPSPAPTSEPTPDPAIPVAGALAIGRHGFIQEGVPFALDVATADWISNGQFGIDKTAGITPEGAGFIFWANAPIGVFADPCKQVKAPPAGASAAELAAAVASIPGTELLSGPTDITLGGYPAKHVVISVREDVACDAMNFYLWYATPAGEARYATELGDTIRVWIVDVNGKHVWIDGETYKGADPAIGLELDQIIESIQFE